MANLTRPTRSWLFTPGTRSERFAKAASIGADVLIIDLEDAVAPADKDAARSAVSEYLGNLKDHSIAHALRVNGLDTMTGLSDLLHLLSQATNPDFLVLPKTESAAHIRIVDKLLTEARVSSRIIGLIESARGLAAVEEIALSSPRLHGLALGGADMAADLGVASAWEPLVYARGKLVAACATAGIAAIDSPWFNIHDEAGLETETIRAVAFGFVAKMAIHPSQIKTINSAFTPSEEEVAQARVILAENEKGVGVVNGQMIDEAVARKARRVLAARRT
jgi:(S)-citramalyl-CoA lyase